jgi:hypothetical protein
MRSWMGLTMPLAAVVTIREGLQISVVSVGPLPQAGHQNQPVVRTMEEVRLTRVALDSRPLIKAIADDRTALAAGRKRLGAGIDLAYQPPAAAPRESRHHRLIWRPRSISLVKIRVCCVGATL